MIGVALLSGGLDSAVAAVLFAREPGNRLALCLFFDYGQRARVPEAAASRALAARWGVAWQRVELPWLGVLAQRSGSRLVDGTGPVPHGTAARPGDSASALAVWVPARNAVFVAAAAAHAEALGAGCIVAGFNREEAATFPDNSPRFLDAATSFLGHGTRNGVAVVSATLLMDKRQIVTTARGLGLGPADFWSCYEAGPEPCGRCESCLRSRWQ